MSIIIRNLSRSLWSQNKIVSIESVLCGGTTSNIEAEIRSKYPNFVSIQVSHTTGNEYKISAEVKSGHQNVLDIDGWMPAALFLAVFVVAYMLTWPFTYMGWTIQ